MPSWDDPGEGWTEVPMQETQVDAEGNTKKAADPRAPEVRKYENTISRNLLNILNFEFPAARRRAPREPPGEADGRGAARTGKVLHALPSVLSLEVHHSRYCSNSPDRPKALEQIEMYRARNAPFGVIQVMDTLL